MKTEQEIRKFLAEISARIDHMYNELKSGNISEKDCGEILHIFQIREDMLELVWRRSESHEIQGVFQQV